MNQCESWSPYQDTRCQKEANHHDGLHSFDGEEVSYFWTTPERKP